MQHPWIAEFLSRFSVRVLFLPVPVLLVHSPATQPFHQVRCAASVLNLTPPVVSLHHIVIAPLLFFCHPANFASDDSGPSPPTLHCLLLPPSFLLDRHEFLAFLLRASSASLALTSLPAVSCFLCFPWFPCSPCFSDISLSLCALLLSKRASHPSDP